MATTCETLERRSADDQHAKGQTSRSDNVGASESPDFGPYASRGYWAIYAWVKVGRHDFQLLFVVAAREAAAKCKLCGLDTDETP